MPGRSAPRLLALGVFLAVVVVTAVTVGPALVGLPTGPPGSASLGQVSALPAPSSPPSPLPSPTAAATLITLTPATPRPTAAGSPSITFDLRGTAWRLLDLPGLTLTNETTPWILFDRNGSSSHIGFSGCSTFGFTGVFALGKATVVKIDQADPICRAIPIRDAFISLLGATTGWAVYGDVLVLTAPAGTLELARDLPPVGDPARALADALRTGSWQIRSAAGVRSPSALAPLTFSDYWLVSPGACGFSGKLHFGASGALTIELGWDTTDCRVTDERPALAKVFNAVKAGTVEGTGIARLTGPEGEIVLVRQ